MDKSNTKEILAKQMAELVSLTQDIINEKDKIEKIFGGTWFNLLISRHDKASGTLLLLMKLDQGPKHDK